MKLRLSFFIPKVSLWILSLVLISPLRGEIFVDFEISHDGEPLGTFRAELYYQEVPRVSANFVGLATGDLPWLDPVTNRLRENTPYYNGLIFHRLIHNFVIQGGDPLGNGSGGPGYVFQDEFHPDLRHDGRYYLSMANSGPNTNGSQFFITLAATSQLDNVHSIFAKVIEGTEIIDGFTDADNFPTGTNDRPQEPIVIESITFSGSGWEDFRNGLGNADLPRWRHIQPSLEAGFTGDPPVFTAFLRWPRQAVWDYPVVGSSTLQNWSRLGFIMSMDDEPDFSVAVSQVFSPNRGFFQVHAVDYSATPNPPRSMLVSGTSLILQIPGGTLTIQPEGQNQGSWSFAEDGAELITGQFDADFELWEDLANVLPDSGAFISDSTTFARLLPVRIFTAFFDQPLGPWGITAIQPTLSFHEQHGGWYNGPINAQNPGGNFRNTFTVSFPPIP